MDRSPGILLKNFEVSSGIDLQVGNVMACDDDVVVEILCRLPGKDLVRCKCVCRAWHRLICEVCIPRFTQNPPVSCISVEVNTCDDRLSWFKHVDVGEEGSGDIARFNGPFRHSSDRILDSCNGLLLLCRNVRPLYYVYNPTTREFVLLPGTFMHIKYCSAALAFDPCKSPHYKVVCFTPSRGAHVLMDVYSSESGRWVGHTLKVGRRHIAPPYAWWYPNMCFFDRTIYCLSDTHCLSGASCLLCFDLNIVKARRIDLPKSEWYTFHVSGTLEASSGHLYFARLYIDELNVWSLEDHCEGGKWILKHSVTYDFKKEVPLSLRPHPNACFLACYGIQPNSDIIFIGTYRMILSYDFKSNTVKEVARTTEGTHFAERVYTHVQCVTSFAKAGTRIFNSAKADDDIQAMKYLKDKLFENQELQIKSHLIVQVVEFIRCLFSGRRRWIVLTFCFLILSFVYEAFLNYIVG